MKKIIYANNNKVIDLTNYMGDKDQVIEYNIYFLFKRQSISFMVEYWKFKIDTLSIKSMEKILPINS